MKRGHMAGLGLMVAVSACAVGAGDGSNDLDRGPAGGGQTASGAGGAVTSVTSGSGVGGASSSNASGTSNATSSSTGGTGGTASGAGGTASGGGNPSGSGGGGLGSGGLGSGGLGVGGVGTGGSGGCPPPPTSPSGCPTCGNFCDDPWNAAWAPSAGATYYQLEYQCSIQLSTYQTSSTSVDLCAEVGMCSNSACANGAGPVTVKACNSTCCSTPVTLPDTPIACGGGVCC